MKQKNILLIVVDCLRADHAYEKKAHIPIMRKWMGQGFSFHNVIASTSTTTPSFASLLTGLYPFQNGVRSHSGYSLKKGIKTFPQLLKEKGYNTYAEVTGPLFKKTGLNRGFDEYNYRNETETVHTEWGEKLLEKFKNHYKEPWFVLLHIWPPHLIEGLFPRRIVVSKRRSRKYGKTSFARSVSGVDLYLSKLERVLDKNTLIVLTGDHGEQISTSLSDTASKRIREMSFRVRKKLGLTKKHFVKGIRECFVGHGYNVYDLLVKVPLIFYDKKLVKKGKSECQLRQIDILPTVVDALSLKSDIACTGKSALGLMKGRKEKNRDAFVEAVGIIIPNKDEWLSGIRANNKYKYIYSPYKENYEEEFYNLEKDPDERSNIAKKNQRIIAGLKKKIKDMKTEKMLGEKMTWKTSKEEEEMKKKLKKLGYF